MLKNIAAALTTTLNVRWTHPIDEPTLRTIITDQIPPDVYFGQLHQLYSEVPALIVIQWANALQVSAQGLKSYYDHYLSQTDDLNPELKEWFSGIVGHSI